MKVIILFHIVSVWTYIRIIFNVAIACVRLATRNDGHTHMKITTISSRFLVKSEDLHEATGRTMPGCAEKRVQGERCGSTLLKKLPSLISLMILQLANVNSRI